MRPAVGKHLVRDGYPAAFAQVLQGWVHAKQGALGDGLDRMRDGLARFEVMGALLDRPYLLALVAEAQLDGGFVDEAGNDGAPSTSYAPSAGRSRPLGYG